MATTPEGITITPTAHEDVVVLLASEELAAVERGVANEQKMNIAYHDANSPSTTYTRAEISVSEMTVEQIREYLRIHRDQLIAFGVAFLRSQWNSLSSWAR